MSIQEIISKHPCPVIKAKLMEHASHIKPLTNSMYFIAMAVLNQRETSEGGEFWYAVARHNDAPYDMLKHLDQSHYVNPRHATHVDPTTTWRKINPDNLPADEVVAMQLGDTRLFNGFLAPYSGAMDYKFILFGTPEGSKVLGLTHYMLLSDLLNLPTEA